MKTDWKLLHKQKNVLIEVHSEKFASRSLYDNLQAEYLDGLIGLIDDLQDRAIKDGQPEIDVFGPPCPECDGFMQPRLSPPQSREYSCPECSKIGEPNDVN